MKMIRHPDRTQLKRSIDTGTEEQRQSVQNIIHQVQENGDEALRKWTETFDGVRLSALKVTQEEINEAYQQVNHKVVNALKVAIKNIRHFHEQQLQTSWMSTAESGTVLGQVLRPLQKVGAYVPGGTAAYPSSVLMAVIPAQVAGVQHIAITTPPSPTGKASPAVLVAADLIGVDDIYKVGGAQAIGALAYGTETIPAVDKIIGPGNIYVTLAKREVFGVVDIDMLAGPSDILVVTDDQQNPAYVAADLLSQAEHDPLSAAVCVTPSLSMAERVQAEVKEQLAQLPRRDIAEQSIANQGAIYVTETLEEAFDVANHIAPEHLEILVEEPWQWVGKVHHAGAIFLGTYSSEPVGDYLAGPSHVLPTDGTARFSSSLHVDDFVRKSSVIAYSRTDFMTHAHHITELARYEGLEAHARAIEKRMEDEQTRVEEDENEQ